MTYSFSWFLHSCRLFLPTVLQMVQVHSSLCTYFILYCLHPLSICLRFFSVCHVYLFYVHSWFLVCWSVYVIMLKQIYHHNSENQCRAEKEPTLSLTVCASVFVCLGAQWPLTRWVGCLRAIKRISVQQQNEPCANQHTVI